MQAKTRIIAQINKSKILVIENGSKLVPIKPICEALGVDVKSQRNKIQDDQILGSVGVLSTSTGADGKQYEMFCLPFKFVFGWLFTINPANVKEEAKEAVINYKLQCYEALYQSFTDAQEFLESKQESVETLREAYKEAKLGYTEASKRMKDAEKKLDTAISLTFPEWLAANRQLNLYN